MNLPRHTDVLVIGAGPAGAMAAALLKARGHDVTVVEREHFPRFTIGESLLPRCMDRLAEAGLVDALAARGYTRKTGAVFLRDTDEAVVDFADQYSSSWAYTWQVPRDDFDKTIADAVADRGVHVAFGLQVTAATFDPTPRVTVRSDGGEHTIEARFVVDASGWGRVLPRLLGLDAPSAEPPRTALFTHVTADKRPPGPDGGRIWICVHPRGGWTWVIPFSDGRTSVGLVAPNENLVGLPDDPDEALREVIRADPNLERRLGDALFLLPARRLTAYASTVTRSFGPGYCLVGNATEFIDPVFSSGVTLAMESAAIAADAVDRELRGQPVNWQTEYADYMARGVDTFRTYIHAWYDGRLPTILFSPVSEPTVKRQIVSVLAGHVWDLDNPFVRDHARRIDVLARYLGARP